VLHTVGLVSHRQYYRNTLFPNIMATTRCQWNIKCNSIWCLLDHASLWQLKNNKKLNRCHPLFFILLLGDSQHVSGINMPIFRSMRLYSWTITLAVLFLVCCVLEFGCSSAGVISGLLASAGNPDTTPAKPHPNSNTQQTNNKTANVVVQQYSSILLKMGILMPETCWVSKK